MKVRKVLWSVGIGAVALASTIWLASYLGAVPGPDASDIVDNLPQPLPISPTPPYPAIVIEGKKDYAFGVMAVGETLDHTFQVRNNGEAPLILRLAKTSCKCTISEFGQTKLPTSAEEFAKLDPEDAGNPDDMVIAPGKSAGVKLTWTGEGAVSPFQQGASIFTNDPQNKVVKLYVNGDVVEPLMLVPPDTWDIGEVSDQQPTEIYGVLALRLADDVKIASLETSHDALQVESGPLTKEDLAEKDAKSGYLIRLKAVPGLGVGRIDEKLTIKAEVKGKEHEFVVNVKGYRPGPIRILPMPGILWNPEEALLSLGIFPAEAGKTFALPLFVSNFDEEFKITDVKSDLGNLNLRVEADEETAAEGKRRYRLVVEFGPGSPVNRTAPPYPSVTVKTNHPDAAELQLFVKFLSR